MNVQDNNNLPLLYEVRKDAFAKSKQIEPDERFFSMVYHMAMLARAVRKEGVLILEEAAKEVPTEIGLYQDIQAAALYVCDGNDLEDLTELLTSRYWRKDLQGGEALLFYMLILSFIRMGHGTPQYLLECLLVECLPGEAAEKYAAYKTRLQSKKPEPTQTQRLLNSRPNIGEGGILAVKGLLEEKIGQADEALLKKVLQEMKETDFTISLKGLSTSAKKKLFALIPDHKAEEYAQEWELMGPVRQIDIMAAMAELIAVFEKQEKALYIAK